MTGTEEEPIVAYVAYNFPVLTQTFTLREVRELRRQGVPLRVFAGASHDDSALDADAEDERTRTTYLPGALSVEALTAALGSLLRRPLRATSTLAVCLGGRYRDDGLRCRLRAVLHFLRGAALARLLRREGAVRRIHAQFVDAGSTVAYTASRLLDLPFSFTNHTAYNPYHLPAKARWADRVISISEYDRAAVIEECGPAVAPKVVVNRVGIDTARWAGLARDPEPGRLLIVGGIRRKKGHDLLLKAAAVLAERGLDVQVRVAGGGPLEPALGRLASELGVQATFLGAVSPETVCEELRCAEMLVLPCRVAENGDVDGIPVVLMEAMAAGVPVVSTRLSGIPELVEDGQSGLLTEPGSVESLADAVERVHADPDLAAQLADGGRERVGRLHELRETAASLAVVLRGGGA